MSRYYYRGKITFKRRNIFGVIVFPVTTVIIEIKNTWMTILTNYRDKEYFFNQIPPCFGNLMHAHTYQTNVCESSKCMIFTCSILHCLRQIILWQIYLLPLLRFLSFVFLEVLPVLLPMLPLSISCHAVLLYKNAQW